MGWLLMELSLGGFSRRLTQDDGNPMYKVIDEIQVEIPMDELQDWLLERGHLPKGWCSAFKNGEVLQLSLRMERETDEILNGR